MRPHERAMQRELKRDFQRQQTEVLRALRGDKGVAAVWAERMFALPPAPSRWEGESLSPGPSPKGRGGEKQGDEIPFNPDDLLDWRAEVRFFQDRYEAYFEETVGDFGQDQLDTLGVAIDFDLRNPLVAQNIRQMGIKFADDINETTQGRIASVLREVLEEADEGGWAIPDIQAAIYDRISTVFDVRKSDYETERIARTEMNKAANAGNLDGMRQSGVVKKKAWLAALDDRTRPTHMEAHAKYQDKPIALEALFEVGADKMTAPGGGSLPEENIFCRCTTVAVIEDLKPEAPTRPPSPFEQEVGQELAEVRRAYDAALAAGKLDEAEGIKGYLDTLTEMYDDERDLNEALWRNMKLSPDRATKANWQLLADQLEDEGYDLYKKYSKEGIELKVMEMRAAKMDGYADVGGRVVQVHRGRFSVSKANQIQGQMWDQAKDELSEAYGELFVKVGFGADDIRAASFDQRRRLAAELGEKKLTVTSSGRVSRIDDIPVARRRELVEAIDYDLASRCGLAATDPLNIPTIDAYRKMQLADVIRGTRL